MTPATTAAAAEAVRVPVQRLAHAGDLPLPAYATAGAAGLDLLAAVAANAERVLRPGERVLVPTGLVLALPLGYEAQIRPRSGLALRHGLTVLNSPGTIDADYRGEVGVLLVNLGDRPVAIARGMRIAQLVVAPCARVEWQEESDGLAAAQATARGAGGFGSTGGGIGGTGGAGGDAAVEASPVPAGR